MNKEVLLSTYQEELQAFQADVQRWMQAGLPGGMAQIEHSILDRMAKVEKVWLQEALRECGTGRQGSYQPCRQCGKPAKYKGDYRKRININSLQQEQSRRWLGRTTTAAAAAAADVGRGSVRWTTSSSLGKRR
jgi:hypothetical protein